MEEKQEKQKKQKKPSRIKSFFSEFGAFIKKGNVLDLAVGIIIGGAFTAIVNSLSNQILKPIINWVLTLILGKSSLNEIYTILVPSHDPVTGALDLSQSIYIDWGAFINAIINFLLIALVLFLIIKTLMRVQKIHDEAKESIEAAVEKRLAEREAEKNAKEEANKPQSSSEQESQATEKRE